jgi:hypothetical protein
MAVDAQHPEYRKFSPLWDQIDDITDGSNLSKYLIKLNPQDDTESNIQRNRAYQQRAIFYGVAGWTVSGMVGTMYTKWPTFKAPPSLDYLKTNCDGAGQSIYQQSQAVAQAVVKNSRAGLCVSFPPRPQGGPALSQAEVNSGAFIPTIHCYKPNQIINWSTKTVGSQTFLALVCTSEADVVEKDFEHVSTPVIRERRIDDEGWYFERKWTEIVGADGVKTWEPGPVDYPTTGNGSKWNRIPFTFVGAVANTPEVNKPLMKEIVHINVGLFRNSADFEDNVWFIGQAQPWMSGLTQPHLDLMKKNKMYIGSRELLGVPVGGQFGIESAPENPLVSQAMKDKISMMIGLGARFMVPGSATKTATQAAGELAMQHSVLSLVASNISEAYTQCMAWCCEFLAVTPSEDMQFKINQDFVKLAADAQMLQAMVSSWFQGALPASDLWDWMRKNELLNPEKSDEDIQTELAAGGHGVPQTLTL